MTQPTNEQVNDAMARYEHDKMKREKRKQKIITTLFAVGGLLLGSGGGGFAGMEMQDQQVREKSQEVGGLAMEVEDLQNQLAVAEQQVMNIALENDRLLNKMANMREMTTEEIIERDVQRVVISYGLVKILDVWNKSKDAKERAALQELLDVKFEMKENSIMIMNANTNATVTGGGQP